MNRARKIQKKRPIMYTSILVVILILLHSTVLIQDTSAASTSHLIVTHSYTPDIIYNKNATWEFTLYNQVDNDLNIDSVSLIFTINNVKVETIPWTINETLYMKSELTKNVTITATMPPAIYEVIIEVHYEIYNGKSYSASILTEEVSILAIDLLSYKVELASTPNNTKSISVYIVNRWEQELAIKEFYFKFTSPSGTVTYENKTLNGQWILYGKKWINTTVLTPVQEGNYALSIICSYTTQITYKSYTETVALSQEIAFATINVKSANQSFTLPKPAFYGLIIGVPLIIVVSLILSFPISGKTCSKCGNKESQKSYSCCGKTYCQICCLNLHRQCPDCGKLMK